MDSRKKDAWANGAAKIARTARAVTGMPALVALAIDDGEGGVFIQAAYEEMRPEDAEFVAGTILRDVRRQMEGQDHSCPLCEARLARIKDALEVLERDGAKPTGRRMVVQ